MGIFSQVIADARRRTDAGVHGPAAPSANAMIGEGAHSPQALETAPSSGPSLEPGGASQVIETPPPSTPSGLIVDEGIELGSRPEWGSHRAQDAWAPGADAKVESLRQKETEFLTGPGAVETAPAVSPVSPVRTAVRPASDTGGRFTERGDGQPELVVNAPAIDDGLVPPAQQTDQPVAVQKPLQSRTGEPGRLAEADTAGSYELADTDSTLPGSPDPDKGSSQAERQRMPVDAQRSSQDAAINLPVADRGKLGVEDHRRVINEGATDQNDQPRAMPAPRPSREKAGLHANDDAVGETDPVAPEVGPAKRRRDEASVDLLPSGPAPILMAHHRSARPSAPDRVDVTRRSQALNAEHGRAAEPDARSDEIDATPGGSHPTLRLPEPPAPVAPMRPAAGFGAAAGHGRAEPSLQIGQIDVIIEAPNAAPEAPAQSVAMPARSDLASRLYLRRL